MSRAGAAGTRDVVVGAGLCSVGQVMEGYLSHGFVGGGYGLDATTAKAAPARRLAGTARPCKRVGPDSAGIATAQVLPSRSS
ncbi:hypothetical protein SSP24_52610 [Streptomyces spinoverrucosus]|uniref:Uncharacterized protein n=1 Tax=Streptomyces spinoverrucosus TaxID=284043 RepID=A0A4Y3VRN0_9ACTN|nr:hypothetical protein SSP24_52610 [Streptomyces spinoverrucosus]GHB61822.1 hypothetical protein GCM10010397_34850 [Streptomyces spinoverrucosus]